MMTLWVEGIGLLGPGLPGWAASRDVLAGAACHSAAEVALPPATCLPAAERRRAGAAVRLALAVGREALAQSGRAPSDMATVFTSSGGDGETIHAILSVLATEQRQISPTRFHNSVHNAPSGYWALACAATAPSTSLCGFDGSFAVGLIDAAATVLSCHRPVTLIAHDMPYPEPLHTARPILGVFGVALVLTPQPAPHSLARLQLALEPGDSRASAMPQQDLEALRRGNPAARSLPLLAALAHGAGCVAIDGIAPAHVQARVAPP